MLKNQKNYRSNILSIRFVKLQVYPAGLEEDWID